AVDEPSFLAQDVQPGVLILQNPQDGLFRDAIDSGAWGPIGAAPEHLRGVLRDFRDRVLDGVREFQEELLHAATYYLCSYRIMALSRSGASLANGPLRLIAMLI